MIYNTHIKIAVKDTHSIYQCKDISLFTIESVVKHLPSFQARIEKAKEIKIKIKCPVCGENHENKYSLLDLIKKQLIVGGCEKTSIPIYFVGEPMRVGKLINKYNEISKQVYAMF